MEVTVFDPLKAELIKMHEENDKLAFDYVEQEKEVRSYIASLRKKKGNVKRAKKEAKAEALEYGRQLDAAEKQLLGELDKMIQVHVEPLERIEAERERKAQAREQVLMLSDSPTQLTVAEWEGRRQMVIDDKVLDDEDLRNEVIIQIDQQISRAKKIEDERAELNRLREMERKAKLETEAKLEAERKIREEAEAKIKKMEAEKAEAERIKFAEERAREQAQIDANRQVEQAKIDAERKIKQAADEQARITRIAEAKVAAEKAELAKRTANHDHQAKIHGEIIADLAAQGITEEISKKVIGAIWLKQVRHVTIKY